MKKNKLNRIGIVTSFLLLINVCIAQIGTPSIINISTIADGNIIDFTLPKYEIKDTSIYELYNINEIYSYVQISEKFGEMAEIGYPNLPQYTVYLHLPDDATVFSVAISDKIHSTQRLLHKILPAQEDFNEEITPEFSIEQSYYNSNGGLFAFEYQIPDTIRVMGANGIGFTIFPFQYDPSIDELEVITKCRFTITHNGSSSLATTPVENTSTNRYLSQIFDNYPPLEMERSSGEDKYLMITAPKYEQTLRYFANYKRNIGYDVSVVTTNTTGTTVSNIINYIKTQYNNPATRPVFILLVGDHEDIPAAQGNPSGTDDDSPVGDFNYTKLEGDDYFADVSLGRFSISNNGELINLINKTIFMETNIHRWDKKAKFVAGQGDNNWQENQFERAHNTVVKETFNPAGYDCQKLYQPTLTEVQNSLNDDPLFFLYRGHGSFNTLSGKTFTLGINSLNNISNQIFPFAFSFACRTGNFAWDKGICFGEGWTRHQRGGVSFFGASISTNTHTNTVIEERVFGSNFNNSEHLRQMIDLGMKDYWERFWSWLNSKRTKRHMVAYNLLGDPSLYYNGLGCISNYTLVANDLFPSGSNVTYQAANDIQNQGNFTVQNGATVNLIAGNTITLKPGFNAKNGSNFSASIAPCNNQTAPSKSIGIFDDILTPLENQFINPNFFTLYPNPSHSYFIIGYTLENSTPVLLEFYTVLGTKAKTFLNANQEAGIFHYEFSTSELNTGIYLYTFKTAFGTYSGKIVIQK